MDEELRDVLERLDNVSETSDGWEACCPAHDDNNPSLSVSDGDEQPVVVHCWAGCTSEEVVAALGLNFADICEGEAEPRNEDDADTLSAVQRERQKLKRRKANTNARLKKVEQAKAKMTESERLLFRMCCNTRPNGETVTELKKAKRNDLIDRALDR
jgi:predicted protein tyrosine phosphatase